MTLYCLPPVRITAGCLLYTSEGRDPKEDFEQINRELEGFSADLATRPQIVLGNKCDIATPEQVEDVYKRQEYGKVLTNAVTADEVREVLPSYHYSVGYTLTAKAVSYTHLDVYKRQPG